MLFDVDLANNITLSCFFFFLLLMDLYVLIPAVMTQIFNPIAELVIPIGNRSSYCRKYHKCVINITQNS